MLLLEDDAARANRKKTAGVGKASARDIVLRLHRIGLQTVSVAGERAYSPGTLGKIRGGRATLAVNLLDSLRVSPAETLIVAGSGYGGNQLFIEELGKRGFNWVVELPRSAVIATNFHLKGVVASELLASARWKSHEIVSPLTRNIITYAVAHLGRVSLSNGGKGRLFAAQTGAIDGIHQGTIIGLSSVVNATLDDLVRAIGWARWIRPMVRLGERRLFMTRPEQPVLNGRKTNVELPVRSNIKLARQYDELAASNGNRERPEPCSLKGALQSESSVLNVVELFAGAGGMGLGFLLAGDKNTGYRIGFSGEVDPIYAATLRANHSILGRSSSREGVVPEAVEPIDLRSRSSFDVVEDSVRHLGDTHVLIGGPPCQGFSNANRNSWHGANPHNELVDVFLKYVRRIQPRVFLMENVQGIVWTPKSGKSGAELTVVNSIHAQMERAGYLVFPKLLDAVWYGVPQYRSRFFLLGIHRDLGYTPSDFGPWGPYPRPTHGPGTCNPCITVRDAIRDLPRIGNGHHLERIEYCEPLREDLTRNHYLRFIRALSEKHIISDHVTSRHAEYVLERYRRIPQGGNWEDIAEALTNYSDVKRTHSNIYRRLSWEEPSITIGHYRKSMLVHPSQNRGLSLREAARLQSFPDWFRFLGTVNGDPGGLMHKQQQLANAVCPLVTKSLAEFLLRL